MPPSARDFLDQHVIIHTHIEKCGGSTLLHYLTTLIGKENSLDLRPYLGKRRLTGYLEIQKKKHYLKLLSGHFPSNSAWAKLVPNKNWTNKFISPLLNPYGRKTALYVASVRHPIERLDSLFRYLKTRPRHYLYSQHVINNDFDGFVRALIELDSHVVNNGICAQLAGCPPGPTILEKAKKAFDQQYLAIVPYNKTHELANVLAETLQLPAVQEKTLNKSAPSEKVNPSQETIFLLERKCQDDIQLYKYVLNKYQAKLASAAQHLCSLGTIKSYNTL